MRGLRRVRAEGADCLFVHKKEPDMADLHQLILHGVIGAGTLLAERRTQPPGLSHPSTLDQLRTLRAVGLADHAHHQQRSQDRRRDREKG